MTPRATYRLQFHRGFTFEDAVRIVPYLASLGISHVYASPVMAARAGSMHGYDGIDPTRINPELGGEGGFRALVAALKARGMGLILDIVPNHMAASAENAWWVDVLRHGQQSRHAHFFDIDWQREDGKVLLPVLGKPLKEVLEAGELVRHDDDRTLRYHEHRFPLNNHVELDRQHYRLAWWKSAGDRINYRRFFDINDLVCLRQEDPDVFETTHALIFRLHREGAIDGVRVDHVDGLTDPAGYCRALRQRLGPDATILVEKILMGGETLPESWACDGTSGYDFMDEVSALQHDPAGEAPLTEAWAEITSRPADFAIEEQAARREMLDRSFGGQLEACVEAFQRVAESDPASAEVAKPAIRRILIELLAHFPVYRTYGAEADTAVLKQAREGARGTMRSTDHWTLDHVMRWLAAVPQSDDQRRAVARFRQLSAPLAAKAVEDTAFYRYGRLLSRNDVGFDVTRFADTPATFHARMRRRQQMLPRGLLATATHDHKRGEDVRARLAVLSEIVPEWLEHLRRWLVWSAPLRLEGMPADADLAMLFQTIVGAWPLDLDPADAEARGVFAERLAAWQQKAVREAKLRSDWVDPNPVYEEAASSFVIRLIGERAVPDLLEDIVAFVARIAPAGAVNSLAQLVLKLTAPGAPDIYQGTELWDFSLVDPDNRRPVDFATRASMPVEIPLDSWRDGRIKQWLLARILAVRARQPALFNQAAYEPLRFTGPHADNFVGFTRRTGDDLVVVIVPRLPLALLSTPGSLSLALDAAVELPPSRLVCALSGREIETATVSVAALMDRWPVVLLTSGR